MSIDAVSETGRFERASVRSSMPLRELSLVCLFSAACAGAPPACHYGAVEGYAYCAFPTRALGECPEGYRAARVTVPRAIVCLTRAEREVPAEVCADLPHGCESERDRSLATPTDLRRAAIARAHAMEYGRCIDEPRRVRLDPERARLTGRADETWIAPYREDPRLWSWGLGRCCATPSRAAEGECVHVRARVAPAELDALVEAIAPIGEGAPRPSIVIDTTPPEPAGSRPGVE
jgi:hypothetical protein